MNINPYYSPHWLQRDSKLSDNELEHYGVLGMKWGVRKNPDRAYEKAGRKLEKLDNKAFKKANKAVKKEEKAITKQRRASTAILFPKFKARSAAKATYKARKAYLKAQAKEAKAYRWNENMKSTFKDVKVTNLNKNYVSLGNKYAKKSLDSIMANNTTMVSLMQMEQYYNQLSRRRGHII